MASDVLHPLAASHSRDRRWIGEALFVVLLLLAFIGVTPFKSEPLASQVGVVAQTGAGDSLRQICYLAVFAMLIFTAARQRGAESIKALPLVLLGLLLWCVASALWSLEPMVTIRRAGLATVLVISAFLSVETVGRDRSLVLWRWVLLAVLVINLVSVKFVPAAVHQFGELDPQLVGNWRGVYGHKNIAGSVAAMTALLFLFTPGRRFWAKLFDLAVVGLSVVFLIGTHSKSSLGLLAVAIVAGIAYRIVWRKELDRTIALVALGLLVVAGTVFVLADQAAIARLLEDPTQFTGRTEIWNAEIAHIRDHPILGSGFGTFAGTGKDSPLAAYIGGWVIGASNGHNGYLQLLVTVGGVGFVLAMIALLAVPTVSFWQRDDIGVKALLFSLFVFFVLHNLMETDFLEGDGVTWVGFLLMLAMLRRRDGAKS